MAVIWIDSRRFVTTGATDPSFANVSLLLHMDGSNGSTTFTDSSSNAVSVTANGNAQISTAQSKFSGASGLLDGNGDYLTATVNTFNVRTDKYTIESWVRLTSRTGFTLMSGTGFYLVESGGTVYLGDGATNNVTFANTELPLTTWFHIAVSFDQTTYRVFVDGVEKGSSTTLLFSTNLSNIEIGAITALSGYTDGYFDDFRLTKDVARYTANFTPPTAPFPDSYAGGNWTPADISTVLWLDADDTGTITESGGAVSQWDDKSGNGRNVSQATSANRPTYSATGLNGLPTIDWGTVISSKNLAFSGSAFTPARIYGVAEWDGSNPFPADHKGLVTFDIASNNDLFITEVSTTGWYASQLVFLNGAATSSNTALPTVSSPFIFGTDFAPSASRSNVWIGTDRTVPSRGWLGKISEIIITASVPDTATKQKLEGYLAHKWGLTANLPANHPYKSIVP